MNRIKCSNLDEILGVGCSTIRDSQNGSTRLENKNKSDYTGPPKNNDQLNNGESEGSNHQQLLLYKLMYPKIRTNHIKCTDVEKYLRPYPDNKEQRQPENIDKIVRRISQSDRKKERADKKREENLEDSITDDSEANNDMGAEHKIQTCNITIQAPPMILDVLKTIGKEKNGKNENVGDSGHILGNTNTLNATENKVTNSSVFQIGDILKELFKIWCHSNKNNQFSNIIDLISVENLGSIEENDSDHTQESDAEHQS